MYLEIHDLLLLVSILDGKYDTDPKTMLKYQTQDTRRGPEIVIPKLRLRKSNENFWVRASKIYNVQKQLPRRPKQRICNAALHKLLPTVIQRTGLMHLECYAPVEVVKTLTNY